MTKNDERWLRIFNDFKCFLSNNHRIPNSNEFLSLEGIDLRSWFLRQQSLARNGKLLEYRDSLITDFLSWDLWYEQNINYINSVLLLHHIQITYPSKGCNINLVEMYNQGAISYSHLEKAISCNCFYLYDFCKRFGITNMDTVIKCFPYLPQRGVCVLYREILNISTTDFTIELIKDEMKGIRRFAAYLKIIKIDKNKDFELLYLHYFKQYTSYYIASNSKMGSIEVKEKIQTQVNDLRKRYFGRLGNKPSSSQEIKYLNLSPRLENLLYRSGLFRISDLNLFVKGVKSRESVRENIIKNKKLFKKGLGDKGIEELTDTLWEYYSK